MPVGVYVIDPSGFGVAIPCAGACVTVTVDGTMPPSVSVSFASTPIVKLPSSRTDTSSLFATGALFGVAVTFITTIAVSHCAGIGVPVSHTRYINVSKPVKPVFGV